MGLRASETVSVSLHDVVVGADAVVGDPGRGFVYAMESIDRGRLAVAAQAVGIAQAALEHSRSYALERHQFGSAIGSFGAIQAKVAEMVIRIEASRALLHEVARRNDAGGPEGAGDRTADAAMTKVLASETAMWTANQAVQIFGGYGYMRDYPVEKLMRDAKGTEIYEGTNEILRMLVARQHLGRAEN